MSVFANKKRRRGQRHSRLGSPGSSALFSGSDMRLQSWIAYAYNSLLGQKNKVTLQIGLYSSSVSWIASRISTLIIIM